MNVKMKHLMTALIASAAVSQALHAQEAPSAVAQDTKQVEQAADGMANKVVGWLDKLSDSVRTLGEKSEEWSKDAATYKDQLKEQWPYQRAVQPEAQRRHGERPAVQRSRFKMAG